MDQRALYDPSVDVAIRYDSFQGMGEREGSCEGEEGVKVSVGRGIKLLGESMPAIKAYCLLLRDVVLQAVRTSFEAPNAESNESKRDNSCGDKPLLAHSHEIAPDEEKEHNENKFHGEGEFFNSDNLRLCAVYHGE